MENREKTTVAVHLYLANGRDNNIAACIENRDRNQYPHRRDYVMAAIEAFEAGEGDRPVSLSELRQELGNLRGPASPKQMLP